LEKNIVINIWKNLHTFGPVNSVFFLLGANLGDRQKQLASALAGIRSEVGRIDGVSGIYESEAWGVVDQPRFLNQAVQASSGLEALEILDIVQKIETDLGRTRSEKWGARTIDIDILYFNTEIIAQERLTVPHPHIQDRRFTLLPLNELAPDFVHPKWKKTHRSLLSECPDRLEVWRFEDLGI